MKKVAIGFGIFIALIIGALLIIPFFISVDKFRPQIQTAIEKQIRGKVELGKISLSLFPQIKVTIDGVKVTPPAPFEGDPLATIKEVQVRAPLTALLTAPTATIALVEPVIVMVNKSPTESSLAATLPPPTTEEVPAATPVGETLNQLPGFVRSRVEKARFRFAIEKGSAAIKDLQAPKGNRTEVRDLNVHLDDIGLNVPMKLDAKLTADVVMGAIVVVGGISSTGTITFKPTGKDHVIDLDVGADLAGLDIAMKPLFHKPSGTAFNVGAKGTAIQNAEKISADMKELSLIFGQLKAGGTLTAELPSQNPEGATVGAKFAVNDFNIQSFGVMVPMIRDFKLTGMSDVDIAANGNLTNPNLDVKVVLKNVSGATPQLAKPLTDLNGTIAVTGTPKNPTAIISPFSMKLGRSDLNVRLESHGILPISLNVGVKSALLDADELLGLQPLKVGEGKGGTTAATESADTEAVAAQPLDASLDQLAPTIEEQLKNPLLDQIVAKVNVDVKRIVALGANFDDAAMNLTYEKRKMNLAKTGLKAYGGAVALAMALDLDAQALGFDVDADLKSVNIARAIAAHMPGWKDVMTGTINGGLKVSGKGLRKEQISKNLRGGLKGEVRDGHLSFPIIQVVGGAVDSLPKIMGKKLEVPEGEKKKKFNGEFKTCQLDTSIEGRKIVLRTLDVVFNTANAANWGDVRFKADGTVNFDRQLDILGIAFLNPEIVRVAELKGPSGQIEIPLKVKGDISDPKPDYGYTAKALGERALKAVASRAVDEAKEKAKAEADKLKAEAKKKAEAEGKKAASKALDKIPGGDKLKNKLKKFKL